LILIFSPMKSEVDDTFGFNCSIVATGTPDFDEITPKVSPACTVQDCAAPAVGVGLRVVFVVVVATCFRVVVGAVAVGADAPVWPDSSPERISTTASVAARRKAAGAT
jgi:hypothetical protein